MLGMIEWINDTVTLKDFICESFVDGKESGIKQLLVIHVIIFKLLIIIIFYENIDILKLLNITNGYQKNLVHQT